MGTERTIVDIHLHVFDRVDGRNRDGKTASSGYGRVATGSGELQIMPPFSRETAFPKDLVVEMMRFAGIDKAVLLQNPLIGDVNETVAEAIKAYPGKFVGSIQADPLDPAATGTIRRYSEDPRHSALKFEMSEGWGWSGIHKGLTFDDARFEPIWRLASERDLVVILDGGRPGNPGYQVESIDRLTSRYPNLSFVLEHLGALSVDTLPLKDRWRQMVDIGKKRNVYLGISALAAGLRDDFPCRQALALLKEGFELVGAEKLLWGSDIPGTLKHHTYRQMVDMVAVYADFLSDEEKDLILGLNALRVFKGFAQNF